MFNKNRKPVALLLVFALALALALFAACGGTKQADVTLAEVKVGETTLTAGENGYSHTVDYEVDKITLSATAADSAATVEGTGEKALAVGDNALTLTVKNGEESKDYAVSVKRNAPILTLSEVKIGGETVTPAADGSYAVTVENATATVNIEATASKSYATVEGAGEKTLALGKNEFALKVKTADGEKEYAVVVTRKTADLTLKSVKANDETLTASGKTYAVTVENDVTEVTIVAEANNPAATVAGAGKKTDLAVGENVFTVEVSVGEEKETYTIVVNRKRSGVKTIASITVDGTEAAYDEDTVTYSATVGKYTAAVVITLDSAVARYELDNEIGTLKEGENEFVVTVTAEDGTTAEYYLVIDVVLPTFNISYEGNVEGAVVNQSGTYKYGRELKLNVLLGAAYTKSYKNLAVSYKVGEAAAKTVTLDADNAFVIPAAEAIGNIVVTVSGIEINTYTVTYHRGDETTTETVTHGENAANSAITPSTETKAVLDGYTYSHVENWYTSADGLEVANLNCVEKDAEVYYRDDVSVATDVAYYNPTDGYRSVMGMNKYLAETDGTLTFGVLITSVATDGTGSDNGKTSFVLYRAHSWSVEDEIGVAVAADEIGKWFTVVASSAKVSVYKPDGTLATEKTYANYDATTLSLAMHADVKIAAINPAVPDIVTVTYMDGATELKKERVIKNGSAGYEYSKETEDLGDCYKKEFTAYKWVDANGEEVSLAQVAADVTVYAGYDNYVYKNSVLSGDTPLTATNKFAFVGADGIIEFRVRISKQDWAAFNIIATGGYAGISGGIVPNGVDWLTVRINAATGEITVLDHNGSTKALDATNYTATATNVDAIKIWLSGGNVDVAVVNANIVNAEFYDTDKKTKLHTELVNIDRISYTHTFEADSEGYSATTDEWALIEGSSDKVYAVKKNYSKTTQMSLFVFKNLGELNKYVVANENGVAKFKVKFTFTVWNSFKFSDKSEDTTLSAATQTGLDVSLSGQWFTFEIDTTNQKVKMTKPDGSTSEYDSTSADVASYAFVYLVEDTLSIEVVTC